MKKTMMHLLASSPIQASCCKHQRIQYNICVEPIDGISDLQNVIQAYIPLMWINKHVSIDSNNTNKLKKNFLNNLEIVK